MAASSAAGSPANAAIPQPFCAATSNATYAIFSERTPGKGNLFNLRWLARNRHDRLAERMQQRPPGYSSGTGWPAVFAELRDAGVTASETGLELAAGRPLHNDSALAAALTALSFTDDAKLRSNKTVRHVFRARSNAEWSRLIWAADAPILQNLTSHPPRLPPRERAADTQLLQPLLRDGFVRVRDFGLNATALREQAYQLLERDGKKTADGELVTARGNLSALEPLLHNASFARVVRSYLGGTARYDGHAVFQLTPEATVQTYPSGWWHHDRCGRRLRVFVFIHDVKERDRPTLYARGSHNTLAFYSYIEAIHLTRFSDAYVRRRYEAVPLTGDAGGGFLLDTNGLHRAQLDGWDGKTKRTAVLLEFHAHRKIPALASHAAVMTYPCPSIKHGAYSFTSGYPGLPLYPPDDAPPYVPPSRRMQCFGKCDKRGPVRRSGTGPRRGVASGRGRRGSLGNSDLYEALRKARLRNRAQEQAADAAQREPMAVEGAAEPANWTIRDVVMPDNSTRDADARDARACFERTPRHDGCAAVFAVAPAPASTGMRAMFVGIAAASARSLKRHLPYARTVLILGAADCDRRAASEATAAASPSSSAPNADSGAAAAAAAAQRRISAGRAAASSAEDDAPLAPHLTAFDEVVRWCDPALYSMAGVYRSGVHRGWLLKPPMLAASPYARSLFLDADTVVESGAIALLFAMLHRPGGADWLAAAEVRTSRSRRSLGGAPIFNSGVIGYTRLGSDSRVAALLARWTDASYRVACALSVAGKSGFDASPSKLGVTGVPAGLSSSSAWQLVTNDQFGLSQLVTPISSLQGVSVSRRTLSSLFNWRGADAIGKASAASATVVVQHRGKTKGGALAGMREARRRGDTKTYGTGRTRKESTIKEEARAARAWADRKCPK